MTLTIDDKRQFLRLAGELSPENLTCDGELRGKVLANKARNLKAQWKALERRVGHTVADDDTWAWMDEVRAADRAKQALAELAFGVETIDGLSHPNANVWAKKGKNGLSAFYIQNWTINPLTNEVGERQPFRLYSEFGCLLGKREHLGDFLTLREAYDRGMAFLITVTAESLRQARPQYRDENIARELMRLP